MNSLLFYTVSEQPSFRIVQNVAKNSNFFYKEKRENLFH
ncbi:unknown [Bacteroides sp. CAG:144]|nr:unknown [Bacteroides sp. CAG:144]